MQFFLWAITKIAILLLTKYLTHLVGDGAKLVMLKLLLLKVKESVAFRERQRSLIFLWLLTLFKHLFSSAFWVSQLSPCYLWASTSGT